MFHLVFLSTERCCIVGRLKVCLNTPTSYVFLYIIFLNMNATVTSNYHRTREQ